MSRRTRRPAGLPNFPPLAPESVSALDDYNPLDASLRQDQPPAVTSDDGGSGSEGSVPARAARRDPFPVQPANPHRDTRALGGYTVLYHVECSGKGIHKRHRSSTVYFDLPNLFEGDSKYSQLRGQEMVDDLPGLLQQQPGVNFLVNKFFDCDKYQQQLAPLFEPLPRPNDPMLPNSVLPYFFSLQRHRQEPPASYETLEITSDTLIEAIIAVTGLKYEHVTNLEHSGNMAMLKHLLYAYDQHKIERNLGLSTVQRRLLDELMKYMRGSWEQDYQEADQLISDGSISQEHVAKLCSADELMVTHVDSQPRAYIIEYPPKSSTCPLTLNVWYWKVDGKFRKKKDQLILLWPHAADDVIPIQDLAVYPLRYASPELVRQLTNRGEIIWKCRKGRYVSYDAPNGPQGF
ncbi:hypothetical protein BJY04DRAFT_129057 [Aspergillus karnatakaensis]|uniref:uncharacterized protein n=1 Tax=Aspergillus karnatakaensis TaxID=1810916 RepID=UPI003CCCF2EE